MAMLYIATQRQHKSNVPNLPNVASDNEFPRVSARRAGEDGLCRLSGSRTSLRFGDRNRGHVDDAARRGHEPVTASVQSGFKPMVSC